MVMLKERFDLRTFLLIFSAALIGLAWALYNQSQVSAGFVEAELRLRVWIIFAIPFFMFWGWLFARPGERWRALFVCFCIYFFSPFVAARYESCSVLAGRLSLRACFVDTAAAQEAALNSGHAIYFQAIVVIHLVAALAVALHRALSRSTMLEQMPPPQHEGL